VIDFGTLRPDDGRCAVRFERLYDATPDELWRALTDAEQLRGWMANTVRIDPRPGGVFEFRFGDADTEWAAGSVEAAEPPRLLELRWTFPGEPQSVVRFEIEPREPGALLILDHRRLALASGASYSAGWHAHLDLLDAVVTRSEAPDWADRYAELRPEYDRQAVTLGWQSPAPSAVREALYRGDRAAAEAAAAGVSLDVFDAAALGDTARLRELLDAAPELVHALSDDGFTPLHLACFAGGVEATGLLVKRGAPLERLAESAFARVRPLGTAAVSRDPASARALLEAGADAGGTGEGGFTPLHTAAQNGDVALAELLLGNGAAPDARAADGRLPEQLAREAGHEACAELLGGVRT
jgi:uncharacterized protein YndB with AHSA1/START domain